MQDNTKSLTLLGSSFAFSALLYRIRTFTAQQQLHPAAKHEPSGGADRASLLAALELKLSMLEPALCEVQQQIQCDPEVHALSLAARGAHAGCLHLRR